MVEQTQCGVATIVTIAALKSVLIVDDHHAFADLLAIALANEADFVIVGTAATAGAGVQLAVQARPRVVLINIELGGQDGLDATRRIRERVPESVVVALSAHHEPYWVAKATNAGASAFAPRSSSLNELLWILRHARNGSMLVAPSQPRHRATHPSSGPSSAGRLTDRERAVLELMGSGVAPSQIARELYISVHTCRDYVKSIHTKLGVRSQLEAVVKAQQLGLIDINEDLTTATPRSARLDSTA